MGIYSGVGAYLSSSGSEVEAYSGGGLIREGGLNRSFTVYFSHIYVQNFSHIIANYEYNYRQKSFNFTHKF